jgi:glycolate oxidase iron-sulfur subunit
LKRHLRVAYHDACHLQHAQGITEAPRQLLQSVPGLVVIDVPENGICCGSAGVYNLEQPEIADQLGRRKVALILSAQTDVIVTGNIGCMVQLRNHLVSLGKSVPVMHTIQLLDLAFQSLI